MERAYRRLEAHPVHPQRYMIWKWLFSLPSMFDAKTVSPPPANEALPKLLSLSLEKLTRKKPNDKCFHRSGLCLYTIFSLSLPSPPHRPRKETFYRVSNAIFPLRSSCRIIIDLFQTWSNSFEIWCFSSQQIIHLCVVFIFFSHLFSFDSEFHSLAHRAIPSMIETRRKENKRNLL